MYLKSIKIIPTNSLVHHNTRLGKYLRISQCDFHSTIRRLLEFSFRLDNMLPQYLKILVIESLNKYVKYMLMGFSVHTFNAFLEH